MCPCDAFRPSWRSAYSGLGMHRRQEAGVGCHSAKEPRRGHSRLPGKVLTRKALQGPLNWNSPVPGAGLGAKVGMPPRHLSACCSTLCPLVALGIQKSSCPKGLTEIVLKGIFQEEKRAKTKDWERGHHREHRKWESESTLGIN